MRNFKIAKLKGSTLHKINQQWTAVADSLPVCPWSEINRADGGDVPRCCSVGGNVTAAGIHFFPPTQDTSSQMTPAAPVLVGGKHFKLGQWRKCSCYPCFPASCT